MALKQQNLERKETYPLERVFGYIAKGSEKKTFDGDLVKIASDRLHTFYHKGTKCVSCGVEGSFFAKERHMKSVKIKNKKGRTIGRERFPDLESSFHFNMYGINEDGREVLMTKDHIIPKSKGGKNGLSNYQTMCTKCNAKKADN